MPPKLSNIPRSTKTTRSRALEGDPSQPNPTSSIVEIEEASPPPNTSMDHQNPKYERPC